MRLCDQCQTIPLWDLPPFQQSDYTLNIVGKSHYFNLNRKDDAPTAAKPLGFHWHQDRGGLWQSAAGGCPLCRLVEKEARLLLTELDGGDQHAAIMESRPGQDDILRQMKEKLEAHLHFGKKAKNHDDDKDVLTSATAAIAGDSNVTFPRPSFDLWLTNRGSSGAGLMVFSTSTQGPGVVTENCLIPIAIIGFCSEPQDPLSNVLTGRIIETVPGLSAFSIATKWLQQCNSRHQLCSANLGQPPAILLDLGEATIQHAEGTITLFEPPEKESVQYVALSYGHDEVSGHKIWKNLRPSFVNIGGNTSCATGEQIKHERLSQVFQDAIVATRRLGLRYLWIDSLCIPPGDAGETWTRDSENLAMVYKNAHLVIAATGASDPSKGLFEDRKPKDYEYFPMKAQSSDGTHTTGNVAAIALPLQDEICGRYPELRSEPLSRSAWAFQERVLARRVLHFARDQLRFECIGGEFGMLSEDGTCSPMPRFFHLPNRMEDAVLSPGSLQFNGAVAGQVPPEDFGSITEPMEFWSTIVMSYSSLNLADSSDRLPGMAQTARAFREMVQLPDTDSDYLAGIWKSRLLDGLMWKCVNDFPNFNATEIRDGTPSWSWASVTGPVNTAYWTLGNNGHIGEILEAYTDVADPSRPFGKVTGGSIKIRAPTIAVSMAETPRPDGTIAIQPFVAGDSSQLISIGALFDTIDPNFDRSAQHVRRKKLFGIILMKSLDHSSGDEVYLGILVTTANDDDDSALKKIGLYVQTAEHLRSWGIDLNTQVRTVTLV